MQTNYGKDNQEADASSTCTILRKLCTASTALGMSGKMMQVQCTYASVDIALQHASLVNMAGCGFGNIVHFMRSDAASACAAKQSWDAAVNQVMPFCDAGVQAFTCSIIPTSAEVEGRKTHTLFVGQTNKRFEAKAIP